MMNSKNALIVSISGTILVALCCFTPIPVILLGAIGLSALVGYLDQRSELLRRLGVPQDRAYKDSNSFRVTAPPFMSDVAE